MKESIETIARWHRETFPDATLRTQLEKFQEEKKEWEQSRHIEPTGIISGDVSELADMFIVACGISRFRHVDAMWNFARVATELEQSYFSTTDLEHAVDAKMEINRARHWNNNGGYYKHTED